jgi:hypothetical protein
MQFFLQNAFCSNKRKSGRIIAARLVSLRPGPYEQLPVTPLKMVRRILTMLRLLYTLPS